MPPRGIDAVARAIRDGSDNARAAVSLTVAEKYVEAFSKLAREGTAVVVPGNVGDMGGMIASAMAVYGKINEGQAKAIASKAVAAPESTQRVESRRTRNGVPQNEPESKQHDQHQPQQTGSGSSQPTGEVAESVLQGFDESSGRRRR
jgi:hypothetical protein